MTRLRLESDDFIRVDTQGTSKGNQEKYTNGRIWVKTNYLGYEDLAEYYVSRLLECSNIKDYVRYELCTIDDQSGCYSKNFLNSDEVVCYAGRMLEIQGITANTLDRMATVKERINVTVDYLHESTGIEKEVILEYFSNILALDAIILNEDRHLYNIAFLRDTNTDTYRPAPIFDNGLSLLSDTCNYRLEIQPSILIRKIKARPFSSKFKNQLQEFNPTIRFDLEKVNKLLEVITEELDIGISKRIISVIKNGIQNYPFLFENN